MNSEIKLTLIVVGGMVLVFGALMGSCSYQHKLDAQAPVVETCIKHPATRSPLAGGHVR